MPREMSLDAQKASLLQRAREEAERLGSGLQFPVMLDLPAALAIIGNLQLALRHPANTGPSARTARYFCQEIICRMREAGFVANAEIARLGGDPAYDG